MESMASTWLRHVDGKAVLRPSRTSSGGPGWVEVQWDRLWYARRRFAATGLESAG